MHPLHILSPLPRITPEGELYDGYALRQAAFCKSKCAERPCKCFSCDSSTDSIAFHTCPFGFSVAAAAIGDAVFRINGVLETATNSSAPEFKKQHKHRKVKSDEVRNWVTACRKAIPCFNAQVDARATDQISAFHEIKSLIGTLLVTSEAWVSEQDGQSFDEKFENSPEPLKTIHHSCRTLESLLQMTDIIANPEAATFGKPHPTSIHGMFYMIKRIFDSKAERRKISIELVGRTYRRPSIYKSFFIIPLVLIDNAIKHSGRSSTIKINLTEWRDDAIVVRITSYGEVVPEDQRTIIFERGARGRNARIRGSGLGLYVAQLVAHANHTSVSYRALRSACADSQGEVGMNEFSFEIKNLSAK